MITNNPTRMQFSAVWLCRFLILLSPTCQVQAWTLEKQEAEISVFSQKTDSGYIRVKATTRLDSKPQALLKLLDDTEAAPEWIANCRKVELLDWFGAEQRTIHSYFSAPWPFGDRDMIALAQVEKDDANQWIKVTMSNRGNHHPHLNHYVRMQKVEGLWQVRRTEDGSTEISYQGYAEAAGSMPIWLANKLMISSLYETFSGLRRQILLDRYQKGE